MFCGLVNESPVQLPRGEKKIGDLSLPLNILHLSLRFQILLHNYVSASGISNMWTYAFGPWSGTLLHVEDAFLSSVNLNLGPGSKLWYFVPRSHFQQLQAYYARKETWLPFLNCLVRSTENGLQVWEEIWMLIDVVIIFSTRLSPPHTKHCWKKVFRCTISFSELVIWSWWKAVWLTKLWTGAMAFLKPPTFWHPAGFTSLKPDFVSA